LAFASVKIVIKINSLKVLYKQPNISYLPPPYNYKLKRRCIAVSPCLRFINKGSYQNPKHKLFLWLTTDKKKEKKIL